MATMKLGHPILHYTLTEGFSPEFKRQVDQIVDYWKAEDKVNITYPEVRPRLRGASFWFS